MPKTVTSDLTAISDTLDNLIYTRLTHRLVRIVPPRKNITIVPCHDLEFIE
ncbi:hypothetical protein D3C78_1610520 [compost metagenome]